MGVNVFLLTFAENFILVGSKTSRLLRYESGICILYFVTDQLVSNALLFTKLLLHLMPFIVVTCNSRANLNTQSHYSLLEVNVGGEITLYKLCMYKIAMKRISKCSLINRLNAII